MSDEARHDYEQDVDSRTGKAAAFARINNQTQWVEQQLRVAHERGDFDDLPGLGKPIEGLGTEHDPDWWVKKLIEREKVAVLPPALQLRLDDARLDDELDKLNAERAVRRTVEEFNAAVARARMQLEGGPPTITDQRDVDEEVQRWRDRIAERRAAAAEQAEQAREAAPKRRNRWWRRR